MNIDKDIEEKIILLKDFIEGNFERDKIEHYKGSYKMGFFYYSDIKDAISNVLKELEKKDEDFFKFQTEYVELRKKLEKKYEELETYKKIAEKLAEKIQIGLYRNIDKPRDEICVKNEGTDICKNNDFCIECIIDWARKEVEK